MILLIDNYDSFSFNLYQMIGSFHNDILVIRNDEITIKDIERVNPSHIVISPGPGRPEDAGICKEVIAYFAGKIPILGVCLGHQAICQTFGGTVSYAKHLMHGKCSNVLVDIDSYLFKGMSQSMQVGRYHSLSAEKASLPACLKVTAYTNEEKESDQEIMAVEHKKYPVYGVQFHPESILTPAGHQLIENFLKQ